MKLEISEPSTRGAGGILIIDVEAVEDIAEFFHNEHSSVAQSYETALSLAQNFAQSANKLDQAWEEINALGGRDAQDNSYDQGIVDTVKKALDIIEALGGMDQKQRALALPSQDRGSA